jgi:hypothetical protein
LDEKCFQQANMEMKITVFATRTVRCDVMQKLENMQCNAITILYSPINSTIYYHNRIKYIVHSVYNFLDISNFSSQSKMVMNTFQKLSTVFTGDGCDVY